MNRNQGRREFIELAGIGIAGAIGAPLQGTSTAAGTRDADLVVFNAKVYTVEPAQPAAQAFAVRAGRFVAIGLSDDIRSLAGPRTQTYDAKGMTVVPGFIDAHNHAPGATLLYEVLVGNPYEVEFVTIQSIVE